MSRSNQLTASCKELLEASHDNNDAVQKNIQGVLNSKDPAGTTKKIEKLLDVLKNKDQEGTASPKQVKLADKLEKVLTGLQGQV